LGKLEKIAESTGFSVSTVSRTLSNQPGVSKKVRAKVIEAAKQLGYPIKTLASVKNKINNGTIAITGNYLHNPFLYEIIEGLEQYINSCGYSSIIWNTHYIWNDIDAFIDALGYHRFSGMICVSTNLPEPVQDFIITSRFPCVTAGRYVASRMIDSVTVDNLNGGILATESIINKGHKRIALISGPTDSSASFDRYRGYREIMSLKGLLDEELVFINTDLNYQSGYQVANLLLEKSTGCTAIFAASDIVAFGVLDALNEKKIRVPQDIAVVGYDNIEMSHYNMIQLTTVNHPKRELGQIAAERLLQLIKGATTNQRQHIVLPVELIERKTL
jgi:DNA-binding LacI/PurR family transcriptional regulator